MNTCWSCNTAGDVRPLQESHGELTCALCLADEQKGADKDLESLGDEAARLWYGVGLE